MKFIRTAVDDVRLMSNRERELFEERAAILEYEHNMDREAAEAYAYELLFAPKQKELF